LSRTVSERLIRFVEFVERCPRLGDTWIRHFRECGDQCPSPGQCESCILSCLDESRSRRDTGTSLDGTDPHASSLEGA
jgi:DtxR family Mn-dependent transcriptional regulator